MTYDEFKTKFPVGSKLRIRSFQKPRPRHVVALSDAEQIAVLKWWRGPSCGWYYEILMADQMQYYDKLIVAA